MTIDRKTDIRTQAKMEYLWLSYYNDSLYNMGVITEDERNKMNTKIKSRCKDC